MQDSYIFFVFFMFYDVCKPNDEMNSKSKKALDKINLQETKNKNNKEIALKEI